MNHPLFGVSLKGRRVRERINSYLLRPSMRDATVEDINCFEQSLRVFLVRRL